MDLLQWDDAWVKLTLPDGSVCTGQCLAYNAECSLVLYGREEPMLAIDSWLFYESEIDKVEPWSEILPAFWFDRRMHTMLLSEAAFRAVEAGEKTIEPRLYDQTVRKLRPGDLIRFVLREDESEVMHCVVLELHRFESLDALLAHTDPAALGCKPGQAAAACALEPAASPKQIKLWGVVGIHLRLLDLDRDV